jgi:2-(1,2-epoxy-1,2-dihydrophenyl)acetyl-CoA isomerase
MSSILQTIENGVAILALNRPEKYNSFNREMALELQKQLDACAEDEAVRCIVITGTGKGFCAGQDLAEASDVANLDFAKLVEEHYNALVLRLRHIEKPVIAAVNGVAAGAGANLALACDFVLASKSASFIQAFSKISLIPDTAGTFFLPRLVGLQRALALAMTADKVTAEEAVQMGMAYKWFEDEAFEAGWKKIATTLAQMPTKAFWLTKKAMNASFDNTLETQLQLEKELQVEAGNTADFKEGVAAFLEKRAPVFIGR